LVLHKALHSGISTY